MENTTLRWMRWAFNCKNWKPNSAEWIRSCNSIQPEEHTRIERFVHKSSAICAMVGRLMLRKSIHLSTGLPNENIKLLRTAEGRPYLSDSYSAPFDVNVSHHGDWVVLVLENESRVGIDVMSLDRPINIELTEYFRLMRRQFTHDEWKQIEAARDPLQEFYRFWCLKESYVKAIGVGLNLNLQTISFLSAEPLSTSSPVTSTKLTLSGSETHSDWLFEESLLDTNHCVAVCRENPGKTTNEEKSLENRLFKVITIDELLSIGEAFINSNQHTWNNFNNKPFSNREK